MHSVTRSNLLLQLHHGLVLPLLFLVVLHGLVRVLPSTYQVVHQVHDLQQRHDPVEVVQLAAVDVVRFANQSSVFDRLQGVESNEDGDLWWELDQTGFCSHSILRLTS